MNPISRPLPQTEAPTQDAGPRSTTPAKSRPGVRGKDLAGALAGKAAAAGYKPLSFITGWSTVNSRPVLFSRRIEQADWEFELQPGFCLNVCEIGRAHV